VVTRAPVDTIAAPLFPAHLPWVNARAPQSVLRRGQPMLVEFWDFCRANSMRTLPYVKAWHERYADAGLRVIGVHCPGFDPSRSADAVRAAVERLSIRYPVLIDSELEVWRDYENEGWPARYLFDGRARLHHYHYGEGAYAETELAIGELLDRDVEPLAPLRAEDAPGARLLPPSEERAGAYSGAYEAGAVWAVLDGAGTLDVALDGGREHRHIDVAHAGAFALVEHERHTTGAIEISPGAGVRCLATCFLPGLAAPARAHAER
jgi:hypothetical protein